MVYMLPPRPGAPAVRAPALPERAVAAAPPDPGRLDQQLLSTTALVLRFQVELAWSYPRLVYALWTHWTTLAPRDPHR